MKKGIKVKNLREKKTKCSTKEKDSSNSSKHYVECPKKN